MCWEHFGVSIRAFHCQGNTAPSSGRRACRLPSALHPNTTQCIPVHPKWLGKPNQPILHVPILATNFSMPSCSLADAQCNVVPSCKQEPPFSQASASLFHHFQVSPAPGSSELDVGSRTMLLSLRCPCFEWAGYTSCGDKSRSGLSMIHAAEGGKPSMGSIHPFLHSPEPTGSHPKAAGCCGRAAHQGSSQALLAGLAGNSGLASDHQAD